MMDFKSRFGLASNSTAHKTQNEILRENVQKIKETRESFQRKLDSEEKNRPVQD